MPFARLCPGLLPALVILAAGADVCTAQMVRGRVVDASTGEGVEAAEIRLVSQTSETVVSGLTSEIGLFAIEVAAHGAYRLSVHHIAYDSTSTRLILVNKELTYLDLRVAPAAVELPGLMVTARPNVPFLEARGFYQRARRALGTFLGPDDIESLPAVRTAELFRRIPGLAVTGDNVRLTRPTGFGGACGLRIIVDGVRYSGSLSDIPLPAIDAVEVYKGPATTPLEWRDASGCGAIVIWTKH